MIIDDAIAVTCYVLDLEQRISRRAVIVGQVDELGFIFVQIGADRSKDLNLIDEFLRRP